MEQRYLSLAIILCVLLPALLVQANEEQIKVTVMGTLPELPDEVLEGFEKRYPSISIEFLEVDLDRLAGMLAADEPPNLARMTSYSAPYYIVRNFLVPIDKYIAASSLIQSEDLESAIDYFRYDIENKRQGVGKLYGLPKDYSYVMDYFYRKDLFEEAGIPFPCETTPLSYEQFYRNLEKLTKREGDRTLRWGVDGVLSDTFEINLEVLLAQTGSALYEDGMRRVNLVNNPEAVRLAKFMFDIAKNRLIQSPIDPAELWLGPNLGAASPRLAIYQYGYWAGALYNESSFRDQIGYAPGPVWKGKALNAGWATGMIMFDSGDEAVNEAAWKFMEYYMGGQPAEERAKRGWGLPLLKSLRKLVPQEHPLDKSRLAVTLAQVEAGQVHIIQGNPWALDPVASVWSKYWGEVLSDNMSFDVFLETVEIEANDLIMDGLYTLE